MGNNNSSGGGASYRNENIVSAYQTSRPAQGKLGPAVDSVSSGHHGVVVNTDKGNSYLIHSTPESGVVCTSAKYMSSQWEKGNEIQVSGTKTVGDAMKGGYTSGSARLGKTAEWGLSGTCIGTKNGVTNTLQK